MNLTVKQLRLFAEYISADMPFASMNRKDYRQLSSVFWEFPIEYMLTPAEYMGRKWMHFAITRKQLIPSSGILSITDSAEAAQRFAENCSHDGTMYCVTPRLGSLILDAQKLARQMHEQGMLKWAYMRRTEQEREYILVNPTKQMLHKYKTHNGPFFVTK